VLATERVFAVGAEVCDVEDDWLVEVCEEVLLVLMLVSPFGMPTMTAKRTTMIGYLSVDGPHLQ